MPECYPINSFGHMLNPRLNRGVSINRLSTGFPLNICGNDTLALVIPECSPLKLALECFNRGKCGDKHYRVSPNCHTRMPLSDMHIFYWIPTCCVRE